MKLPLDRILQSRERPEPWPSVLLDFLGWFVAFPLMVWLLWLVYDGLMSKIYGGA